MADIKSAREIALEKIARLGDATEEEQLKWKYVPEGEKLAASCLNDGCDIKEKIDGYDKKVKGYVLKGAESVFIAIIGLPRNDAVKGKNKKAMDNLMSVKKDKAGVKEIFGRIDYLFGHYDGQGKQQREQAYQLLKSDFQSKLNAALDKKLGSSADIDINIDALPQFQEEWHKVLAGMDAQYSGYLDEYKRELKELD
jgi:hypothetical protein